MILFKRTLLLAPMLLSLTASVWADISLPALFSNGMVMQRETVAPMWGQAEPGEKVRIESSWGAVAVTTANSRGDWQIVLSTPSAGGPFTITLEGHNTLTLQEVYSGEVWFCGGQSNMDFSLAHFAGKAREPHYQPNADYVRNEIKTATDPLLRQITVPRATSPFKKKLAFEGSWMASCPQTNPDFSATGYFFARKLRQELKVPVGLIKCAWGGTRIQPWLTMQDYRSTPGMPEYYRTEMEALKERMQAWDPQKAQTDHEAAMEKWNANGRKGRAPRIKIDPVKNQQLPATLFNGMVAPVIPYAIKGVIWYQGESNSHYMTDEYENYFSTLIRSWRSQWRRGDMPFYWAQLAGYKAPNEEPLETDNWASICDQQRRCLKLPHTGMAVLNDIGEANDVHPHNKMDAGERLALWALANEYGIEQPAYSGPLYANHSIEGRNVRITFSQVGSGLMAGKKEGLKPAEPSEEPLKRFQITGADRVWKWATAQITAPNTVTVFHPDIAAPVAVRYAWSSNPEGANLYNKEGLPASLFTTE